MTNLLCMFFGHLFYKVMGGGHWSLWGHKYELSHCYRCGVPNEHFIEGSSTLPGNKERTRKVNPL